MTNPPVLTRRLHPGVHHDTEQRGAAADLRTDVAMPLLAVVR
ncbi:hypothetical protein [Streptomyces sp. NPDC048584]